MKRLLTAPFIDIKQSLLVLPWSGKGRVLSGLVSMHILDRHDIIFV